MPGYCAVACIQMWAAYDGRIEEQEVIAVDVGVPSLPHDIVNGIDMYTNSVGWIEFESSNIGAAQDLCIAYSIASIDEQCPSIMPFEDGNHAVLSIGFQWHTDAIGKPIAEFMTYHDPAPAYGGYLEITAGVLKDFFSPVDGNFYVIVGRRLHTELGTQGYAEFLLENGTYYGGPIDYVPEITW